MKNIRIIFAVSALLFAIGGAFASKAVVTNRYYEFVDNTPPTADKCEPHDVEFTCSTNNTLVTCEISGIQLRPNSTVGSNQCGAVLFKQP